MTPAENKHAPVDPIAMEGGLLGQRLRRLLGEQKAIYDQLDTLSERQRELIASDDVPGLVEVLTRREALLESLSQLAEAVAPFRARWDEILERLSGSDRQAVGRLVNDLTESARRIADRDEADRQALEARRRIVSDELRSVSRGRSAMAAYGSPSQTHARYQDRSG